MKRFKAQYILDILLVLICLHFAVSAIFDAWLKNYLLNKVNSQPGGKQKLEIKSLHASIFFRSVELKNVSFASDTVAIFKSELINLSGIGISDFSHKLINVDLVETKNSLLALSLFSDSDTSANKTPASAALIKEFKKWNIGKIELNNLNIEAGMTDGKKNSKLFSKASLSFTDFKIDSSTVFSSHKLFDAAEGTITLTNFKNITDDSLYTVTAPLISLSYSNAQINIDSLQVEPNFSKKEFAEVVGKQCDRFIIYAKRIESDSLDVKQLVENGALFTSSIHIDSMHVMVYRNKYVKDVPSTKKFIRHLVTDLKMPLKIASAHIKNSYVEYEELLPPSLHAGKLFFTKIKATLKNISNLPADSASKIIMNATGKLNDESPVENNMEIYLNRDFVKGTTRADRVNMPNINEMIEASVGAQITNGFVDSLFFNMEADGRRISGPFKFFYHDLRVAVKDVRENDTMQTQLRFKTFLANAFIIKKRNPDMGKPVRVVQIDKEYDDKKFLISNLWKSMMGGIKQSVGIPGK